MGFFNNFPYTNFHEMNLDWILKEFEKLKSYVEEYTAVNNVSYAGVWNITEQYPQWSIVTNKDKSYLSKKPVPVGISIDNEEYWLHLADLDPRIAGIIVQLTSLENDVGSLQSGYDTLSNNTSEISVLNFGAKGDGVTDDTVAFQKTIDTCIPHGVVVIPYTGKSYVINGTINVDKPIKIVGLYAGLEPFGASTSSAPPEEMGRPLINHTADSGYCVHVKSLGVEISNISIVTKSSGFLFDGTALNYAKFGRYLNIENCDIHCDNTTGICFYFKNCFRVCATNCNGFGGTQGFFINGATSTVFTSCWARGYNSIGWVIKSAVYTSLVSCASDAQEGSTGKMGYYIGDSRSVSLLSCGVENASSGLNIDEGSLAIYASLYCVNVGADENSYIVVVGNYCSVHMSCCASNVPRKIEMGTSGSLLNVSTCNGFSHVKLHGADNILPSGFWSSAG